MVVELLKGAATGEEAVLIADKVGPQFLKMEAGCHNQNALGELPSLPQNLSALVWRLYDVDDVTEVDDVGRLADAVRKE